MRRRITKSSDEPYTSALTIRERTVGQVTTHETGYYLLSGTPTARMFAHAVRGHWGSKTRCIGCLMSRFVRMPVVFAQVMQHRTFLSCAISPSTCCAMSRPKAVSRRSVFVPLSTRTIYSMCSRPKMRLPWFGWELAGLLAHIMLNSMHDLSTLSS